MTRQRANAWAARQPGPALPGAARRWVMRGLAATSVRWALAARNAHITGQPFAGSAS